MSPLMVAFRVCEGLEKPTVPKDLSPFHPRASESQYKVPRATRQWGRSLGLQGLALCRKFSICTRMGFKGIFVGGAS